MSPAFIEQAYQYNKAAADTTEQRFDKTAYLSRGVDFEPELKLDQAHLRDSLEQYAEQHIQNPINAVASFDADTETFSYTPEQNGVKINTNQLISDVMAAIDSGENAVVEVTSEAVPADITVSELKKNTVLVSSFRLRLSTIRTAISTYR